jgi:hypothetical protein
MREDLLAGHPLAHYSAATPIEALMTLAPPMHYRPADRCFVGAQGIQVVVVARGHRRAEAAGEGVHGC